MESHQYPPNRGWRHHNHHYPRYRHPEEGAYYQNGNQRGGGHSRGRGGRGRGRRSRRGGRSRNFNYENQKRPNFYCCSCERGFKTQDMLDNHNKEHIVCGLEGCLFEAHSLVVTKHIRMQHEGNLYQRMKNLNTPDDIQKWRAERKKNFPTSEKVQQMAAKPNEKTEGTQSSNIQRRGGPVVTADRPFIFRYRMEQQDRNRQMSFFEYQRRVRQLQYEQSDSWTTRPFAPDLRQREHKVPFFSLNKSKVVTLENFYLKAKMGCNGKLKREKKVKWMGLKVRKLERLEDSESEGEGNQLPISDDDDADYYESATKGATTKEPKSTEAKSSSSNASMRMLVNYSSASSDSEDDDSCKGIGDGSNSINNSQTMISDQDSYDSDSSTQSMFIEEFEEDAVFKSKPTYAKVGSRNNRKRQWMRTRFLETLLQDQIRKERTVILQACKFIEKNNFFD